MCHIFSTCGLYKRNIFFGNILRKFLILWLAFDLHLRLYRLFQTNNPRFLVHERETYCISHCAAFCDRLIRHTLPSELWRNSVMTSGNGIWSKALTRALKFNHVTCAQNFKLTLLESYCGKAEGKNLVERHWIWGSNPWSMELQQIYVGSRKPDENVFTQQSNAEAERHYRSNAVCPPLFQAAQGSWFSNAFPAFSVYTVPYITSVGKLTQSRNNYKKERKLYEFWSQFLVHSRRAALLPRAQHSCNWVVSEKKHVGLESQTLPTHHALRTKNAAEATKV